MCITSLLTKLHSGLIIHIYNFAAAAIYSSSNWEFGLAEEMAKRKKMVLYQSGRRIEATD
jgi:hypothetical protein